MGSDLITIIESLVIVFSSSLVLRTLIDLGTDLILMKDAARMGYKFKMNELSEALEEEKKNTNKFDKLEKIISFIPIVNVLIAIFDSLNYFLNKEAFLRTLINYDAMETMNVLEDKVFLDKPTIGSAYDINHGLIDIPFCRYKETGIIYYYIDENNICYILKAVNEALELSLLEQRDYVLNDIKKNMPSDNKKRVRKR